MKPKELLYFLGLKPRIKTYGTARGHFDLPKDGRIEYARWLHPRDYTKEFPQSTVDDLRRFIHPGDVAIDVGAHGGDSTLPLALAAGAQGCVLAFEPNPYVYPVLEENTKLNTDRMHILPFPFAATAEDGDIEFQYSDSGFCNGGRHEGVSALKHGHMFNLTVPGRNIEHMLAAEYPEVDGRISFVKTDAEGYDGYVLRSIRGILERNRPYVQSEIYKCMTREQRIDLIELMQELGYRITKVDGSICDPDATVVTTHNVMQWPNYDVFCQPDRLPAARQRRAAA